MQDRNALAGTPHVQIERTGRRWPYECPASQKRSEPWPPRCCTAYPRILSYLPRDFQPNHRRRPRERASPPFPAPSRCIMGPRDSALPCRPGPAPATRRVRPELGGMVHRADTGPARSWCRRIERSAGSHAVMSVGAGPRACPDDATTPGAAPSQMGNHGGLPLRHCDQMTNGADVSLSATVFRPLPTRR